MTQYLIILAILFPILIHAQTIDQLIELTYQRAKEQQEIRQNMDDYTYRQSILFSKLDGDGDIDEQSRREFMVYVRPPDLTKRVLISAEEYNDGEWQDIANEERQKNRKAESQQFSLLEMVGPDYRNNYEFNLSDTLSVDSVAVYRLDVSSRIEDQNYFEGILWIRSDDYSLTRARLSPSDMPTGLKSMEMGFFLQPFGDYWLPSEVTLDASVSFLFIFKGQIKTSIRFSNYQFNQDIPDAVFAE